MPAFILTIGIGILCIVLGIINMRGNVSSLHYYHRKNVAAEDIPAFGKLVGLGTVIVGAAIVLFGAVSCITLVNDNSIFTIIGTVILFLGLIVGMGISFYAMKKYNGGIF